MKLPQQIGRYAVSAVLGRGGMGAVYRATDPHVGREVALKVVLSNRLDANGLQRFHTEAQAVARLRHPGIVNVHELGVHEGRPFLVMDLIEGESLKQRLERTGPLEPEAATRLAVALAAALVHAHSAGILHRDVKPANILLSPGGPVLTDFGLAKDLSETRERLTRSGEMLGTPAYMAPEQAAGELERFDGRTDVYSLGATLYCMLTGRPPFQGASPINVIKKVLTQQPAPPSSVQGGVPFELDLVCLKCLAKDSDDRYASAAALREDLERFLRGEGVAARPLRKRSPLPAVAALAVGLLLAAAFGVERARRDPPIVRPARVPASRVTQPIEPPRVPVVERRLEIELEIVQLPRAEQVFTACFAGGGLLTSDGAGHFVLWNRDRRTVRWRRLVAPRTRITRSTRAHNRRAVYTRVPPNLVRVTLTKGESTPLTATERRVNQCVTFSGGLAFSQGDSSKRAEEYRVWTLSDDGQPLTEPFSHDAPIQDLAATRDGRVLVIGTGNTAEKNQANSVTIRDLHTGVEVKRIPCVAMPETLYIDEEGAQPRLFVGLTSGEVLRYSLTGEPKGRLVDPRIDAMGQTFAEPNSLAHRGTIRAIFRISRGRIVTVANLRGEGGRIKVWPADGEAPLVAQMENSPDAADVSPDGQQLVVVLKKPHRAQIWALPD